jgi:hypothetical protein
VYSGLGREVAERMAACRALFRAELDAEVISDIPMALIQGQPPGESRFIDSIERASGRHREVRPRGRPRKPVTGSGEPKEQLSMDI